MASAYGVRLHFFNRLRDELGYARYWRRSISIYRGMSPGMMISVFFHELGHVHCFETSRWQSYHLDKLISEMTHGEKTLILRTALRAERWIDRWARAEMRKHFLGVRYYCVYDDPGASRRLRDDLKRQLCVN